MSSELLSADNFRPRNSHQVLKHDLDLCSTLGTKLWSPIKISAQCREFDFAQLARNWRRSLAIASTRSLIKDVIIIIYEQTRTRLYVHIISSCPSSSIPTLGLPHSVSVTLEFEKSDFWKLSDVRTKGQKTQKRRKKFYIVWAVLQSCLIRFTSDTCIL